MTNEAGEQRWILVTKVPIQHEGADEVLGSVSTEEGYGTTFTVTIPLQQPKQEENKQG